MGREWSFLGVRAAIASVRANPTIRHFYRRLRQRGKPAKVALCARARKRIRIAWAVVAKRQSFDPDCEHQTLWALGPT
jgi:hypothetical protein